MMVWPFNTDIHQLTNRFEIWKPFSLKKWWAMMVWPFNTDIHHKIIHCFAGHIGLPGTEVLT